MDIERNNETEPLAPVAPLAEAGVVAQVLVEVGPVDDVRRPVGLGVADKRDALPPRQRASCSIGPPVKVISELFNI